MEWKNKLTRTPYLVLFTVLIAISVGSASALITITLAGNVIITDDLTVDTNTFFVDSSENKVGLGTITPSEKLDVKGNVAIDGSLDVSNAPIYSHRNPGANTANLIIERTGGPTSDNVQFTLSHRSSNKDLWLYGFNGTTFKNFVGFDYPNYKINFPTSGDALVIDGANDRVGIGTSTPAAKLDVVGNVTISENLEVSGKITGSNFLNMYTVKVLKNETATGFPIFGAAVCDLGDFVTGGGGECESCGDYEMVSSTPNVDSSGWTIELTNPDSSTSGTVKTYAICLDYEPLHLP